MAKTVVGLFEDFRDAQNTVQELESQSFTHDQVSIIANDTGYRSGSGFTGHRESNYEAGAAALEDGAATGAGAGAAAGTAIGGTVGLLAGLGALAIPGFGPIVAAGPLVAAITGAGIGAATGAAAGGLIGALTEAGLPEDEARLYQEGIQRGGTLVTVRCGDEQSDGVIQVMRRHNALDINQQRAATGLSESGSAIGRAGYAAGSSGAAMHVSDELGIRPSAPTSGYSGVVTGSNTGYNAVESDVPIVDSGEDVGADADYSGTGAAVNRGYTGINSGPPVNSGESFPAEQREHRDLAGVAHEEMPSRDDMSSTIPARATVPGADTEEELGEEEPDANRRRPGSTNIY